MAMARRPSMSGRQLRSGDVLVFFAAAVAARQALDSSGGRVVRSSRAAAVSCRHAAWKEHAPRTVLEPGR